MCHNAREYIQVCHNLPEYIHSDRIINIQVCHNVLKYIHPDCNKYTSLSQCSRREGEGCRGVCVGGGGGGHEGAGEVQLTDGGGRSSDSQHGLGKLSHHFRLN